MASAASRPVAAFASDDDGRRDADPGEHGYEEVRERAEDELENELAAGAPRLRSSDLAAGGILGRERHPASIVDTPAVATEDWSEVDGALERTFELPSFVEALAFVNRLGELAEAEDHHPDIAISYRNVTVRWWTHTAGRDHRPRSRARREDEHAVAQSEIPKGRPLRGRVAPTRDLTR